MKISKAKIQEALSEVLDPELNISIVDLGLVYQIDIKNDSKVKVVMTLTTIGCPLFATIETEVKSKLKEIGIKKQDITLELTFDPPWSIERMSESAKAMLGI
jgi:metal-sulfur cluster biosynthetic enzyme